MKRQRNSVQGIDIDAMITAERHIAEEVDLAFTSFEVVVAAGNNDVWLNTDLSKFLDRVLCGFGLSSPAAAIKGTRVT